MVISRRILKGVAANLGPVGHVTATYAHATACAWACSCVGISIRHDDVGCHHDYRKQFGGEAFGRVLCQKLCGDAGRGGVGGCAGPVKGAEHGFRFVWRKTRQEYEFLRLRVIAELLNAFEADCRHRGIQLDERVEDGQGSVEVGEARAYV